MKVLQVVSISFSLKYFIGNQFKYFKDRGVRFYVSCSPSDSLDSYADEMGFSVFPVEISRSISPLQDLKSIFKLYKYIKENDFDVVIAHSPKGGLVGMISSFLAKTPKRVFFRHGLVFETSSGLKRQLLIFIEKLTSRCAHTVVNVSQSVQDEAIKLSLNRQEKNLILGRGTCNGINIDNFKPRQKVRYISETVVGFVGRLSNDKGITELVGSWELLLKKYKNIRLLLIGPIDDRDGLVPETLDKIDKLESIEYLGAVDDTSRLYNDMDIFVLPSYREGFPTVTLEASASALPIVTTKKTGCIDSIIENHTGIFTELNPEAIAGAIEFYILNKDVAIQHGDNGRKFVVDNFSEEKIYNIIDEKLLS
ncbi:glycosyltransferase family 4 protein [Sphingobacterium hotanense]|uniref:glycosyltransferase family 4 protein n=1 Tax=Sphingobacterium hotanense TaxID=649196 RepID=UPI0011F0AD7D|nr:glycosyltransferase family 4 protein [Sphingobacterium hotanense]